MTLPSWVSQLALNQVFKRGVDLAISDPMAAPLVALSEGVKTSWRRSDYHFRTTEGGVFVLPPNFGQRSHARLSATRWRSRLSVARTIADARELALSSWGAQANFLFDGKSLEIGAPSAPEIMRAYQANLSEMRGKDPAALAKRISFGDIQVLATGEPVVWIDPLHCARTPSRECARRIAAERRLDLSDNPDVVVAIPTGRVRLQFDDRVGKLRFRTSSESSITHLAANLVEIATEPDAVGAVDVRVASSRAQLRRVGVVLSPGHARQGADTVDPLARYADLLNIEDI